MKKNDNSEIENTLKDLPAEIISLFKESLDTGNVKLKLKSRKTLVRMGKTILPLLHKLSASENVIIRMEAVKILELVADRRSMYEFIRLLEDKEFDIRWTAAEGLIRIGRRSIRPLTEAVRDGENSIVLNEGAHHVLTALLNETEKKNEESFLLSLENYHTLGGTAPLEASSVLEKQR
jgi:HEAT repeat protein